MTQEVWLGDCLELMKNIPDKSVDLICCDLPYFKVVKSKWDNQWVTIGDYFDWIKQMIFGYNRIMKDNSSIFLFTGRQCNRYIAQMLDSYFDERRIIIWERKRNFNTTRGKALASSYEPICYYSKGNPIFNNIKIKIDSIRKEYVEGSLKDGISLSDVWNDIPALPHNSKEKVKHETQKPIKIMERIISIASNEGDLVLDNCAGSGTTLVAAKNLNRQFIGIEKEKEYYDIILERLK